MMRQSNQKYSYISHPQNLPLEVNGRSKKRIQPLKKQQFNGDKPTMNEQSRTLLLKKLSSNTHQLDDMKSIIPTDNPRKKNRPSSIKVFNDNKENIKTGIEHLMQRTASMKGVIHKQKAHICQFHQPQIKRPQKKHFASVNIQKSEPDNRKPQSHKKTSEIKLTNDLYSNIYRNQNQSLPSKRIQSANLFKSGEELGLQKRREKRMTQNKLVEMFGSECMRKEKPGLRERRQDWRTSNINFF